MDKERCLLCQCKIEEPGSCESPEGIIFLLGKVLGVPAPLLSKFRRGSPRVEGWVSICEPCQELVRECHQIYEQLSQLTRKWSEGQARIRGMIRDVKVEGEEDAEVVVLDIGREVRDFVLSSEERDQQTDIPAMTAEDDDLEEELTPSTPSDVDPLADECPSPPPDAMEEDEEESDGDWEWETPEDQATPHRQPPPPPKAPPKNERLIKELQLKYPSTFRAQLKNCTTKQIRLSKCDARLHCPVLGCSFTVADPEGVASLSRHQKKQHSARQLASLPPAPAIFECVKCQMRFSSRPNVKDHLRRSHAPGVADRLAPDGIRCPVPGCSFTCPTLMVLRNHTRHSHTKAERDAIPKNAKLFECRECGKRFRLSTTLRRHQLTHSSEKRETCDICGTALRDRRALQIHKKTSLSCRLAQGKSLDLKHKCPECDKRFATPYNVKLHLRQYHQRTPLQCTECGRVLRTRSAFNGHMASVHGQGDFPCPECGRVFFKQSSLDFHVDYQHKGTGGFFCEEEKCGKRFPSRRSLENHVNEVHLKGEPGYKCQECDKAFYSAEKLGHHRKSVHKGRARQKNGPRRQCPQCPYTSGKREGLEAHVKKVHEGQFPLHCEHCGQGVTNSNGLRLHQALKHGICGVKGCGVRLENKEQLHGHQVTEHGREWDVLKCSQCEEYFVGRKYLDRHQRLRHPPGDGEGERHVCELCGKGFPIKEYLSYHVAFTHNKTIRRKKSGK